MYACTPTPTRFPEAPTRTQHRDPALAVRRDMVVVVAANRSVAADPLLLFVGGQDVYLRIPLLQCLARAGYRIAAVGSGGAERFGDADIPYRAISLRRNVSPIADLRAMRQLRAIYADVRPAIIHAFDTKPILLAPAAARRHENAVMVRTVTGMGRLFSTSSAGSVALRLPYVVLQRAVRSSTDLTVFQNSTDMDYFLHRGLVAETNARLIPGSGVDIAALRESAGSSGDRLAVRAELGIGPGPIVTMISRIVYQKGVLDFLRAAEAVHRSHPDCTFLLVGPRTDEGRHGVSDADLDRYRSVVRYVGPRTDIAKLLAISDMFVFPTTYREGIPRVLLEAGALGVPLIATDVPGCCEVVFDGESGLRVPPNDPVALGRAITLLLDHPGNRRAMGTQAAAVVERFFSLDQIAKAHRTMYDELLSQRALVG
jgi:glycosyltransferase involved in cell wall biosynthesis